VAQVTSVGPLARVRALDWRRMFQPQTLIILGVVGVIGYLALIPLGYLLWGTFFDESGFTLDFFREAYTAYGLGRLVGNSLWFAFGSTVVAVSIGTVLAYLIVRTDVPFKGVMFAISLVPLIIPGILHTIAWIFLASPRIGIINKVLEPVFGPGTFDVFTLPGMMWVEGLHLSPLVFLLMFAAFRSMDPSLEESALMSGARLGTVFRRITVPLVRPALFASILVMAVRALESFETPALLGIPGGIWVFTSRIWRVLNVFPREFGQAGAYSMSLLLLCIVGVFLYSRLGKKAKAYQTVTGKGFRPRAMELGRWRRPATALIFLYGFVAVVLPLFVLVYLSTQPFYEVPSLEKISTMTLDNYRAVFDSDQTLRALKNSFMLGVGSATFVMFIMAIGAWLVVRTKIPGRWMVDNLSFLPLVIPGLVLGVALLFVYLISPVPIYGTIWIIVIALATQYISISTRLMSSGISQVQNELEEAAAVSGASWWPTIRRVVVPLVLPAFMNGLLLVFLLAIKNLTLALILYTPDTVVLSTLVWTLWDRADTGGTAAVGTIMVAITVVLGIVLRRVNREGPQLT
jgi:iron(III) transport system permease protein